MVFGASFRREALANGGGSCLPLLPRVGGDVREKKAFLHVKPKTQNET
tara:strand:- start:196 stop:339 length:144 start_codon:yes stop_codon:yes gene_type:complete